MGDNNNLIDCYFYCYKTCKKESWCPFRHCEAATKTKEVCDNWLKGICDRDNCPKRHMDIEGICRNLEKGNLASKLINEGLERDEALNLAKVYFELDSDPSLLKQTCEICAEEFSRTEMFYLMTCKHEMCTSCAVAHFEEQIRAQGISKVVCPFANCTNLKNKSEKEFHEYFSYLISQLKAILPSATVELLETKLRDYSLEDDPNFMWCPKCVSGMIRDDTFLGITEFLSCPNCRHTFCIKCKKPWVKQHAGINCEQFEDWEKRNDPRNRIEIALQEFLDKFGVACPRCRAKFAKSPGGCLHLICPIKTCEHEFCEGCLRPFHNGKECPEATGKCEMLGFHAHHPRNCFFYLRDWEPARLQQLLKSNNVAYETIALHTQNECPLMEQKEKDDNVHVDEECGLLVEPNFAGLCRKHYVQYLGWLVLHHKLDPLPLYTIDELTVLIKNAGTEVPEQSTVPGYQKSLMDIVKKLQTDGGISETTTISDAFSAVLKLTAASSDDEYQDADDEVKDDSVICIQLGAEGGAEGIDQATGGAAMWQCSFCTLKNEDNTTICAICSRTRVIGYEDYEIDYDGIECTTCTYINENAAEVCLLCGSALPQGRDDEID